MTWITASQLLGGVILLGNAFFVTTEFALTRVRQFDEQDFQQHAGLRRAWEMTEELRSASRGARSVSRSAALDSAWLGSRA